MRAWPVAAGALALAAYAWLSHWLMVNAAQAPWAVAALFGPLVAAIAGAGWHKRQPGTLAACAALVGLLALIVLRGGIQDIQRMYVLQHSGIHAALAWGFGMTLRGDSTALITALAERLHHRFTPTMQAYTRWLTGLWAAYFGAMAVFSWGLYLLAPWSWWSAYANLLTPLSAAGLFVVEHTLRYRRHPEFERVSMRSAIAAYRSHGAAGPGPRA